MTEHKETRYVMLYANNGDLISFHPTHEKEIHFDHETGLYSFTDNVGNRIQWNGLILVSNDPVKIKDKPEVTNSPEHLANKDNH